MTFSEIKPVAAEDIQIARPSRPKPLSGPSGTMFEDASLLDKDEDSKDIPPAGLPSTRYTLTKPQPSTIVGKEERKDQTVIESPFTVSESPIEKSLVEPIKQQAAGSSSVPPPPKARPGISSNNTSNTRIVAGLVGALAGVVFAPVLLPAAVGILGFGSGGVVAGSIAASAQAAIGNVAAGSAFAIAQGVGAGAAVPASWAAVTGALAGVGGVLAGSRSNGTQEEGDEDKEDKDGDEHGDAESSTSQTTANNRHKEIM